MQPGSGSAATRSQIYRSASQENPADAKWRGQQEQKLLRLTLDRCSLFGLTIGLKVLEIGYNGETLRAVFQKSLQDIDYKHFDLVGAGASGPPRDAALQAFISYGSDRFDVIILNHVSHAVSLEELQAIATCAQSKMRPNGILIVFDYFDVDVAEMGKPAEPDTRLQARLSDLVGGANYLAHAHDFPRDAARPPGGVEPVHLRAVFRGTAPGEKLDFSSKDYAFEMRLPFGRSLATGHKFGIFRGKWNLIIGRSGSGKTTFLRALQGDLRTHTTGAEGFPSANYFNMPQNVDVFESLSPIQNVRAYGGSPAEAVTSFEQLGMAKEFQQRSHAVQISGGERQRLLVAQIMAADPELIILDEPSKGLDRAGRLLIFNALAERFAAAGKRGAATVVCADHDFAGIYPLFDYVFELQDGIQTLVWQKPAA